MKTAKALGKFTSKPKQKSKTEKELEKYQAQAAEYLAGWQRARADYQNLKKDCEEEKNRLAEYIKADMLQGLAVLVDNFELALRHVPTPKVSADWLVGFEHLKNQLDNILADWGAERIKTVGQEFATDCMEAVEVQVDDQAASGQVVKELSAGYRLNGQVIKPAKVIVAK